MLVHDLALERAHRLELHRAAVVDRGLGGLVGGGPQRDRPTLAIAGGVDASRARARRAAERDAVGEVLDRVDRLAVVADQQPEVLADELGDDPVVVLVELDPASTPIPSAICSSSSRTHSEGADYLHSHR